MPLFSLDDTFNLTQPPLDLDNFYQPRLSPTAVVPSMSLYSNPSASPPSPPPTVVPSSVTPPPATPSSSSLLNSNATSAATRKKRKKDASILILFSPPLRVLPSSSFPSSFLPHPPSISRIVLLILLLFIFVDFFTL